jgi:hypothetical protein
VAPAAVPVQAVTEALAHGWGLDREMPYAATPDATPDKASVGLATLLRASDSVAEPAAVSYRGYSAAELVRNALAASLEFQDASGITPAAAAGNGSALLLDARPANHGGERELREPLQSPAPGANDRNDALKASPASAAGAQNFSPASGSPPVPAVLPQTADTAGMLASDLTSPPEDPAGGVDPSNGPPAAVIPANSELAFGARLLPDETVVPAGGAADALASPGPAARAPLANPEAGAESRSMQGKNEHAGTQNTENQGTARGALGTPPGNAPSESQGTSIPGTPSNSGGMPEERSAAQRYAGPPATAAKGTIPLNAQLPGVRGENASQGQESFWNAAMPAPSDREAKSTAPPQEASAAGPAEVELPDAAAQPVSHDVSLHLGDGNGSVDIRMAERAGEIRVTVHTPDRDLANSLRADLPDLVGKLRQSGFQAEAWRPAATQPDANRRSGSDGAPSQEHSPGERREGRQRQPQQQQSKDQPRWAGEWKSSLAPAQESHI